MSKVETYQEKIVAPAVEKVQVVQFTGSGSCVDAIQSMNVLQQPIAVYDDHLDITVAGGTSVVRADLGDFIVQSPMGNLEVVKPAEFGELYEPVPTTKAGK